METITPQIPATYADSFPHAFDGKGRITVPADWRVAPFENRLVILRSEKPCLSVYPASWFGRLMQEKMKDLKSTDPIRIELEHMTAGAHNATFDQQGRIIVKEAYRRDAGLKTKAMLVGCYDHFKIWDRETWAAQDSGPVIVEQSLRKMNL